MKWQYTTFCTIILFLTGCNRSDNSITPSPENNNTMTLEAKHISISVAKPAAEVYEFTSNPENLPKWVPSFFRSIKKEGEYWIANSPLGEAKVKFAEKNNYGILDHYIALPNGVKVYNPLRVIKNNEGCEVVLTLFRLQGVTDKEFEADANSVAGDLKKLKEVLER